MDLNLDDSLCPDPDPDPDRGDCPRLSLTPLPLPLDIVAAPSYLMDGGMV